MGCRADSGWRGAVTSTPPKDMVSNATSAAMPRMRLGTFFAEILPLAGFFIGFHLYGLFVAAAVSVGLGALVMTVNWWREKRLARFALFSVIMSGSLTVAAFYFHAAVFIKIQPTLFNGLFAAVLLGGLLFQRAMMREFFGTQFFLNDKTWFILSRRWGLYFLVLAVLNEVVWRHFTDAEWVAYKTFFVAPASFLFMLAQLPVTLRGRLTLPPDKPV
jgi:intracellular septation protein